MSRSDTSAEQRLRETEEVFTALAHASRRQILMTIWFRGGEVSAGDIAQRFRHSWPTISRHLRILVDAGLIAYEKEGRVRLYRLNLQKLMRAQEWLGWFDKKKLTQSNEKRGNHDHVAKRKNDEIGKDTM